MIAIVNYYNTGNSNLIIIEKLRKIWKWSNL